MGTITISTKAYNFDTNPTPDSARYVGPAQTATIKDSFTLKRIPPKPTKDFAGNVKTSEKTVKTVLVNGVYRDAIAETTFTYPVGAPQADVTALRVDHAAGVANACTQTLVDNTKINI